MDEWSCSEWIEPDMPFIPIGEYWYPLHFDQLSEAIRHCEEAARKCIEIIADAVREVVECLSKYLCDTLPNISIALDECDPEQYIEQPRERWKQVRYIGSADRMADHRPSVHHIRNALPNMNRDRREKRRGD